MYFYLHQQRQVKVEHSHYIIPIHAPVLKDLKQVGERTFTIYVEYK